MDVRSRLRFAMRRIFAAAGFFLLAGAGLGVAPSSAAEVCKAYVCATTTATPSATAGAFASSSGYATQSHVFYLFRVQGKEQMKLTGPGMHAKLDLEMPAAGTGPMQWRIA